MKLKFILKMGIYYHLYNRGVEKRKIFLDKQDYATFLSYLKTYLMPKNEDKLRKRLASPTIDYKEKNNICRILRLNNFSDSLTLLAYSLMPNHFHFLVQQTSQEIIDKFMNSLGTRYSMYFNSKYKRIGPLFQGVYKGVLMETDEQLLYLSCYLHYQAYFSTKGKPLSPTQPSSYPNYLGNIHQEWIKPNYILSYFKQTKKGHAQEKEFFSYKAFVEGYQEDNENITNNLLLE